MQVGSTCGWPWLSIHTGWHAAASSSAGASAAAAGAIAIAKASAANAIITGFVGSSMGFTCCLGSGLGPVPAGMYADSRRPGTRSAGTSPDGKASSGSGTEAGQPLNRKKGPVGMESAAVRNLVRRLRWPVRPASASPRVQRALAQMDAHPDEVVQKVARAFRQAATAAYSPQEQADFAAVEAYRHRMDDPDAKLAPGGGPKAHSRRFWAMVASKSPAPARLIYSLVDQLAPRQALELGTAIGVSASYIGLALRHRGGGRLTTIEMLRYASDQATQAIQDQGLQKWVEVLPGRFEDRVPPLLAAGTTFDLAFKDGQHTSGSTLTWWEALRPHLRPGGAFLFDDIRWSLDMNRAWRAIAKHPDVAAVVDFYTMGLVVVRPGRDPGKPPAWTLPL
jgi:predicted O-methyltransferase YrrM